MGVFFLRIFKFQYIYIYDLFCSRGVWLNVYAMYGNSRAYCFTGYYQTEYMMLACKKTWIFVLEKETGALVCCVKIPTKKKKNSEPDFLTLYLVNQDNYHSIKQKLGCYRCSTTTWASNATRLICFHKYRDILSSNVN